MLPKLLEVPIKTYVMVVAKILRPSMTPSARTSRSLFQQDCLGGVFGDVSGGVDGDPDIGTGERLAGG
jgi:hypothetical protein